MNTCVVTANYGGFDKLYPPVEQSVLFDYHAYTEENYPLRHCAMTPRLQARMIKTHAWQLLPDYDVYLWVDASCQLDHKDSVKWFLEQLGDADIAAFRHPERKTILDEAEYLQKRLSDGNRYITSRYENELIQEQLKAVNPNDTLYATTAMIYRKSVNHAMKEWWYHISRYHIIDQLSFTYCFRYCKLKTIEEHFQKTPYLTPRR